MAGATAGLRTGEADRRHLSAAEIEGIVRGEVSALRAAARHADGSGHPGRAVRLRAEAGVLTAYLDRGTR